MGESIYGQFFRDERFLYRHDRRGILSMAKGNFRNTNNSQFFVTFGACPWLDGKHVAFGHVQSGLEVLDEIEKAGTERGKPLRPVEIFACGEVLSESFFKLRDSGVAAQRRERNTDARVEEQRREATRIAAAAEEDVHVQSAALKEEEDGNEIGRHQSAPARGADDGKSASWERGESSEPAEDESPPTPPRPVPSAERTKERPALLPSPSEPNFVPVEVYRRHKYF
uniref:PPIase cyclophilin-type domain-containing protein n=1 Tax=Chromera velia CCMP2878 TaxID=1169474 RepID=A0A0G4HJ87_9ALVE|eukprot:Cvel_28091.t1-p1 / transcript=Cvel_28091.t1 / gene=Cvel_28091 / organism=Chromera_velia_CCMP2878 / gene_product=Peptidyl-prolyl cis-trans isomerase slr1251, putative / transcript_product=Peptidyl-prolyl cis-trans isomerase slr1251, putative / location=Cvel_scaffold3615:12186-15016(-) / protein_length=225 / sequence_SO=supercontig / SO=protein_coding / is_pseudo=false